MTNHTPTAVSYDVTDLASVITPRPCPQCRHPESITLLTQGATPKVLATCCRYCKWVQGDHALVREYMASCGRRFVISCAACGEETDEDFFDAIGFGWRRIGRAWICPDFGHQLRLRELVLREYTEENRRAIKENRQAFAEVSDA